MSVNIETVRIKDKGNRSDRNGYGRVDTNYSIGKYEVTVGQYSAFLNSVATSDPYRLYNPGLMTGAFNAGITRSGAQALRAATAIARSVELRISRSQASAGLTPHAS